MEVEMRVMYRRVGAYAADVIKHSRRKPQMLQGHGDTIICTEVLAKELAKERGYSSRPLMKYDGQSVEYRNNVQQFEKKKDRLRKRNKSLKQQLRVLEKTKEDLQGRVVDWQNSYYQVTDYHDKLSTLYENLDHHLQKKKKMRKDGEVDLVNTMKTLQEREAELEATKLALK
ncbi:uncharacterized protein [Setaria viridis]|uniref:Uncharacterized protein n=1 Tax=Setaria viridis TaxID=4556 RepID=A0A4U6T532_SETVI|nr:uncharacterized protein LOC117840011 [Setaria viridis]TKV95132.1 hypothetical protein SEVIR_9G340850v2 [Setaria viridis]